MPEREPAFKKPLPKHIKGEFDTMQRRKESLLRLKARLQELEDKEVDISEYYEPNPREKYYKKWLDKVIEDGLFVTGKTHLYSYAFQSCWPEESPNMIFQYLYKHLNVKFKWWAKAKWNDNCLSLVKNRARISKKALPNANCLHYACPGDYGEKFYCGSRISKMNELYNYTSSPNLRENDVVTSIYSAIAAGFQYCPVEVKRNGEIELTTIADLWIELIKTVDDTHKMYTIRDACCHHCNNNENYVARDLYTPEGSKMPDTYLRLMRMFNNDVDKINKVREMFDRTTLYEMCRESGRVNVCQVCAMNFIEVGQAERTRDGMVEEYKLFFPEHMGEVVANPVGTTDDLLTFDYTEQAVEDDEYEGEEGDDWDGYDE